MAYPQTTTTPYLGLSLESMNELMANNLLDIDAAIENTQIQVLPQFLDEGEF